MRNVALRCKAMRRHHGRMRLREDIAFQNCLSRAREQGAEEGFERGKASAERAHTQFRGEVRRGYWIGPEVKREIVVMPLVRPPELEFRLGPIHRRNDVMPTVRFRCGVKAVQIEGVTFTMPNWELIG